MSRRFLPRLFSIRKSGTAQLVVAALLVLLPTTLACLQVLLVDHNRFGNIIPQRGDDISYFKIVQSMIHYGRPLGYWGYNFHTATVGTFGAWSFVGLIPYAIFGRIFGWGPASALYANVTFITIALGLFIIILRPKISQLCLAGLAVGSTFLATEMMLSGLIESEFIACAIVLASLFLRMYREDEKSIWLRGALVALVLFMVASRPPYAVFVLPCAYVLLGKNMRRTAIWGVASTVVAAFIGWLIMALFASKFFYDLPLVVYSKALKNGVPEFISAFWTHFRLYFLDLFPFYRVDHLGGTNNLFFIVYVFLMIVLLGKIAVDLIARRQVRDLYAMLAFVLVGYFVGVALSYFLNTRLLLTPFFFVIFVLLMIFEKQDGQRLAIVFLVACYIFLGVPTMPVGREKTVTYTTDSYAQLIQYHQTDDAITGMIQISSASSAYANSIMMNGLNWGVIDLSPPGAGVILGLQNAMMDLKDIRAKYILLTKSNSLITSTGLESIRTYYASQDVKVLAHTPDWTLYLNPKFGG